MNKHKRTYLILSAIILLGTFFTLGFSSNTNNVETDHTNQPSYSIKPGFTCGVGWVAGNSVGDGYGVILHTTDGGKNWVRQGSPDEIPDVNLVTVSAIDPWNAWVVGAPSDGYGVILRTKDGGRSWVRQGDTSQIPDVGITAIHAINKYIAWAAGDDGVILRTIDGGRTWTRQAQGMADGYQLSGVYASAAWNVWVSGGTTGNCPNDLCYILLHSTNGGRTWERLTYEYKPDEGAGYLISVHALNARTVWTVGNGTVLQTTDGGETWQNKNPYGVGGFFDWNGVFAVNENAVWFSRDNDGIFMYDSSQWHVYSPPPPPGAGGYHLVRVSAIDPQRVWIIGQSFGEANSGIILHTDDGGENWEVQNPGIDTGFWGVSFVKSVFCESPRLYLPLIYALDKSQ